MSALAGSPLVRFDRHGTTAHLTIDNPPVNVLTSAVLHSISEGLSRADEDPEVRAVVLDGAAPRAFAAGANIRDMVSMGPKDAARYGANGQGVTVQIERLPLPVIAAVHGSCLGGGCEIAQACDFILASEDAVFGQPEVNLGIMPGWGGTRRLPRRIGAARAREWILMGRSVPALEARAAGLVWKVVPRETLLAEAYLIAEELARRPALALAAAKYAINRSLDPLEMEGLAFELSMWSDLFGTDGQREGMRAFLEKRAPKVSGRGRWSEESRAFPFGERRKPAKQGAPTTPRPRAKGKN